MRKARGFAISIEAIAISGLIAFILFVAFMYATNYIKAEPKLSQTTIEARLCGTILTIKNVGSTPAHITKLYVVEPSGSYTDITSQLTQTTLQPGDVIIVTLSDAYNELLLLGENFEKVVIKNECT